MSPGRSGAGMAKKGKVLVVGIDGGTLDLLVPLVRGGRLPNFAKLLQEGCYGILLSTLPPVTAPAWASFITGKNPAKHGVFYFVEKESRDFSLSGKARFVSGESITGEPFWKLLNQHGVRTGIVNVPLTYPPRELDGFMITGMMTPPGSSRYTYPPDLAGELDGYIIDLEEVSNRKAFWGRGPSKGEREAYVQRVREMTWMRGKFALRLMKEKEWDLFMVVFTGSDRLCHFFWPEILPDEKTFPGSPPYVGEYYVLLDQILGSLVECLPRDGTVAILSDHGFGKAPSHHFHVNLFLKRLGFLRRRSLWRILLSPAYWVRKIPLLSPLARQFPPRLLYSASVDFEGSAAFFVPLYGNVGGVALNPALGSAAERDEIRGAIERALKELKDPQGGGPIVQAVFRREEVYQGDFLHRIPHLVFVLQEEAKNVSVLGALHEWRPRVGEKSRGDHRREGLFILKGPHIRRGRIERRFIYDMTATLLHLFGIPVPSDYDGRVMGEAFEEDYLIGNPVLRWKD